MNWRPYLKAIAPAIATVLAVGIQWIATGEFSRAELATALTGLLTTALAYFVPNLQGGTDGPPENAPQGQAAPGAQPQAR